MRIVYAGNGVVGERCLKAMETMGLKATPYSDLAWSGDLLISVHWRELFPAATLAHFNYGGINLHNAFLPWGRGADAVSWAIAEKCPHGATLHWMNEKLDQGNVIYQELLTANPDETADQLYKRTADLEVSVFEKGLRLLLYILKHGTKGSYHSKADFTRLTNAVNTRDWRAVKREV